MKRARFLIPSLLAAGMGLHEANNGGAILHASAPGGDPGKQRTLLEVFKQSHAVTLAQHRSHSSHSSHGSHRSGSGGHQSHSSHTSHRSSNGGYAPSYSIPAESEPASTPSPAYAPPPPPSPSPDSVKIPLRTAQPGEATPPQAGNLTTLSGRTKRFKEIVERVQIALLAQGDYSNTIDGIVGSGTRGAIRRFQERRGLDVTGSITPELLDALRVSSE